MVETVNQRSERGDLLLHSDFVSELDVTDSEWSVRHIGRALRVGFGVSGAFRFYLALTLMLFPSIVLACYAIVSSRYGLLAWSCLAFMGFRTSSTGPTGVGMIACSVIAGIGLIIALQDDWLHVLGGVLPGATWFGACAIKGTAMTFVEERLRASAEYFAILERDGNLVATRRTDESRDT